MSALQFLMGSFSQFLMVVLRLAGIFIVTPVFSNRVIPGPVKGILVLMVALIAYPPLAAKGLVPDPGTVSEIIFFGVGEMFIGFLIGVLVLIVITIFQVSGQFYSIQMGFGIINVFDPLAESSVPIISQLKTLLMTILFLLLDGHHLVFRAVFRSYKYLPTGMELEPSTMLWEIVTQFDEMFQIAFLIGVPLIGVVFLMSTTLGILTKIAPQMNVMIIGFGLKVMVGLSTFIFLLPEFIQVGVDLFRQHFRTLFDLFKTMGV
ncbi:MAG: flagellar biosynthetic protein FliR [bacterium]